MGNVIIKSLQFLVRLLEWEYSRLNNQQQVLEAAKDKANAAWEARIHEEYDLARRKLDEVRHQRDRALAKLDTQGEGKLRSLDGKRAKAQAKAAVDSKLIDALGLIK